MKQDLSKLPEYSYEKEKYKAACGWLFGDPKLPNPPLSEFVYQSIIAEMIQKDDQWVFDKKRAAKSIDTEANKYFPDAIPISPNAFEAFLKNLFKGMHEAYAQGMKDGPLGIGMGRGSEDERHVSVRLDRNTKKVGLYFVDISDFATHLSELEASMNNQDHTNQGILKGALDAVRTNGFIAQCYAHFLSNHIPLHDTNPDKFSQILKVFISNELKLRQKIDQQRSAEKN
jgi:hypothetical protein